MATNSLCARSKLCSAEVSARVGSRRGAGMLLCVTAATSGRDDAVGTEAARAVFVVDGATCLTAAAAGAVVSLPAVLGGIAVFAGAALFFDDEVLTCCACFCAGEVLTATFAAIFGAAFAGFAAAAAGEVDLGEAGLSCEVDFDCGADLRAAAFAAAFAFDVFAAGLTVEDFGGDLFAGGCGLSALRIGDLSAGARLESAAGRAAVPV